MLALDPQSGQIVRTFETGYLPNVWCALHPQRLGSSFWIAILPYGERIVARETTTAREAEFALAWKREHDSWLQLEAFWQTGE